MTELGVRLGLDVHRDQWPATPLLKSYEAAGFGWVQIHAPPRAMLTDRERRGRHARALRGALGPCRLRLVVRAPEDLVAGTRGHDRAFDGLLNHAAAAGAAMVVYQGFEHPMPGRGTAIRIRERAGAEERSLQRLGARADALGLTLAIVNGAPRYPGRALLGHDVSTIAAMVRRLDAPAVRMALDVGHAHITAGLRDEPPDAEVRAALDVVELFCVSDNLGARRHDLDAPGVDPVRLDLHLPPGAGTLPWDRIGPLLAAHHAPLLLEVERSRVPAPATLATVTTSVLGRAAPAPAPA